MILRKRVLFYRIVLVALIVMTSCAVTPSQAVTDAGIVSGSLTTTSLDSGLPLSFLHDADQLSCRTWSLVQDMSVAPNQENPNRDSCGNAAVWYFLGSSDFRRVPQLYYPLPYFYSDVDAIDGLQGWLGASTYDGYHVSMPMVIINTTGEVQHPVAGVTFLPDTVHVHPAPSQMVVIGWRSPVDDWIAIRGAVTSADTKPGDGIRWFIDKDTTNLASGAIGSAGSQSFRDGVGGSALGRVLVRQGEFIYFLIHPNGTYYCDSTRLTISITRGSGQIYLPLALR